MSERVVIYRWAETRAHLELELASVHKRMENAESDRELWELKGAAKQLRKMMTLPETLTFLKGE